MNKRLISFLISIIFLAVSMPAGAYVELGTRQNKTDWAGLSTETKPTGARLTYGSTFYETDTLTPYVYTGSWVEDRRGGSGTGLPDQSGAANKYLTTNGTDASWAAAKWGLYASVTGPTQARTYTLPDMAAVLLYSGGALGTPLSGVLDSCKILSTGVENDFVSFDSIGKAKDSGYKASDFVTPVVGGTTDNFLSLTASGTPQDSTYKPSDFALSSISIDPTTYKGIPIQLTAGENIAYGEVVYGYFDTNVFKVKKALATANTTCPVIAICVQDGGITTGNAGAFIFAGTVTYASWSWTTTGAGAAISLVLSDNTAGAMEQGTAATATGNFIQILGTITGAHSIIFNPSTDRGTAP